MSEAFDPYHVWLGIPPQEQPPNHYRLLGISLFENNPEVIRDAVMQRTAHVRTYQLGKHLDTSQRILNEIARAKTCLQDIQKKAAYDAELRESMVAAQIDAPEPANGLDESFPVVGRRPLVKSNERRSTAIIGGVAAAGVLLVVLGGLMLRGTPDLPNARVAGGRDQAGVESGKLKPVTPVRPEVKSTDTKPLESPASKPAVTMVPNVPPVVQLPPASPAASSSAPTPRQVAFQLPAAISQPPQSPASSPLAVKVAAPDAAAQALAIKQAQEIFKQDYEQARDPAALTALARRILQKASEIQNDLPARFVFLFLAREFAVKAGDNKTAFEAIDRLADSFAIDPWEMKAAVLNNAAKQLRNPPERKQFAQEVLALMKQALEHDAFTVGEQMAKLALTEGGKLRDREIIIPARDGIKQAEQATEAFAKIEAAFTSLKSSPNDPAANLTVGRYLCFTKGDWENGLVPLSKCSDRVLKSLAEKEQAAAGGRTSAATCLELGDGWWELSQYSKGPEHDAMLSRAGCWYRQAVGDIKSDVLRIKVETRLEEVAKLGLVVIEPMAQMTFTSSMQLRQKALVNSIGMKFVLIPAGEFEMGSEVGDSDEKPVHRVRITKPFYLGATEVTQGHYEQVMGANPSNFKRDAQRPVEQVSWEDSVEFCRKLSQKEGKEYRLPTEAEWEYACRAGSSTEWCFGDEESPLGEYAWYDTNSDRTTHPVGQKKPNAWGLYDMHGNVWEWCQDWKGDYGSEAVSDPIGPSSGSYRVSRSGSWLHPARGCRSADRIRGTPGDRYCYLGLRVLLVPADDGDRQAVSNINLEVQRTKVKSHQEEVAKRGRDTSRASAQTTRFGSGPQTQKTFVNSIGMPFVLIPAGEFMMGSSPEEVVRALDEAKKINDSALLERITSEGPRHRIGISHPFYLGVYEVTQAEYAQVMGVNPSSFSAKGQDAEKVAGQDTSRHPVEMVSWDDAVQFCQKLSLLPQERVSMRMYRLPTEAEWEYVCRAGSTTKWSFGDDPAALGDHAWFGNNSGRMTHPVGQKKPNAWGLYDLYGNVYEWCMDRYDKAYYATSPKSDPAGPSSGALRVSRGGGWGGPTRDCCSAVRSNTGPGYRGNRLGLRVLLVPAEQ